MADGHEPFGTLIVESSRLVPYLLIVAAFTFIYMFMPNTRVRGYAAAIGGLVAGFLWQANRLGVRCVHCHVIPICCDLLRLRDSGSAADLAVHQLAGAADRRTDRLPGAESTIPDPDAHPADLEQPAEGTSGVVVMYLIALRHQRNEPAWNVPELAEYLGLPDVSLASVIAMLCAQGYLVETQAAPPGLLPACDISPP